MRIRSISAGLGEQAGGLLSRLVAGGTRRVLGDALKSWQSTGADATQDGGGIEGAAAAASVAGQMLQGWYGGGGGWGGGRGRGSGPFPNGVKPNGPRPNKGAPLRGG